MAHQSYTPSRNRDLASFAACYLALVSLPAVSFLGTLLLMDGSKAFAPSSSIDKTVLDQRVNSMRQIQQALATPVPPAQPLPPLTVKAAHALRGPTVAEAPRNSARRLPKEARDAFASSEWSSSSSSNAGPSQAAPVQFDRHTSNY
jgi:hypothetical protein